MSIKERTCVICRKKGSKDGLLRFVVGDKGVAELDKDQKKLGRGFYVCSEKCWEEGVRKGRKIRFGSDAKKAVNVSLPNK